MQPIFGCEVVRKFRLLLGVVLLVIGAPCQTLFSAEPDAVETPKVGWNGYYLVGRWTPVVVPVTNAEPRECQLELEATDPDGNRVRFLSKPGSFPAGSHHLTGLIKPGRLDGELSVRVNQEEWKRGQPGRTAWLPAPLKPSTRLIVTVGQPAGFDFGSDTEKTTIKIAAMNASELPETPLAYDGVSSLVLAGSPQLTTAQVEAVREWVSAGGRLVVSLPQDVAASRQALFSWVPVSVKDEPAIVREFGSLEAVSGKNVRIPQRSTLNIPHLEFEAGQLLASSRSVPFIVRVPYAMGSVTILAMDLTASPLREWKELSAFCARLTGAVTNTDVSDKMGARSAQLSSTGITDLSTQLHAIQEHFRSVQRIAPWMVMAWLLALLLIVGPLDYLIVHRILKRPYLTWVTFPLFVVGSALLASSLAASTNGSAWRSNQLNIINYDITTGSVHGRHFVNLYSPKTEQRSLAIEPMPLIPSPKVTPTARTIWEGVPESSFGGMLREKGLERDTIYEQTADGQLTHVPIMQWSTKGFVADSRGSAEGLVEANLKASATGSLTGTIVHRFASPIEDWMLVYQNRVYRQLKTRDDLKSLPLPPKQVWRVEQPGIFQRELRPFLTGILTMATPKFGARASNDPAHQQSAYDPLSLEPFDLVRILTFHDEVGADRYTGLTNQLMVDQDCSHLLKLGRAILFGRVEFPVATIRQEGDLVTPDQESSFVRLILPVTRSGELLKELKRVVPD